MDDLFQSQDVTVAELLHRIEALEAIVLRNEEPGRTAKRLQVPDAMRGPWARWDAYRKVGKRWTADAKARNLDKLVELSGGRTDIAELIVGRSIERGWTGLFELPEDAKPKPVATGRIGAQEALKPTQTKLQNALDYADQMYRLHGDAAKFEADKAEARRKYG